MKTDIEIAQGANMLPIDQVAAQAGIDRELLEHYGRVKAKIDTTPLRSCPRKGKLILVTAITPRERIWNIIAASGEWRGAMWWRTLWNRWAWQMPGKRSSGPFLWG